MTETNHTDFAMEASSFDLIGDIRGYAELLAKLGYREWDAPNG